VTADIRQEETQGGHAAPDASATGALQLGAPSEPPVNADLAQLVVELIRPVFTEFGVAIPTSENPTETLLDVKNILERQAEGWKRQWRAVGRAEGLGWAEGFSEGFMKGKAETLVCLLVERFGAITPTLRGRISKAKLAMVERWFKRAIVAPDLSSVFARH
jgi:hypothetical protein